MTLSPRPCQEPCCTNLIPITASRRRMFCDACLEAKHKEGGMKGKKHTNLEVKVLSHMVHELQRQVQQLTRELIVAKTRLTTVETIVIKTRGVE